MRNKMLDEPIIDTKVLSYLRIQPLAISEKLSQIEVRATDNRVPIIPRETAVYLYQLVARQQPKRILEVGTAIGFSAALFVEASQQRAQITTIDRFEHFRKQAILNWQDLGYEEQITSIAGDAADVLPELEPSFDIIFLDAAKAQYIKFIPQVLRLLSSQGILLIDDVLQGGTVLNPIETIRHRDKGIHRNLNELFERVYQDEKLLVSLLPLGDGLLQITRRN